MAAVMEKGLTFQRETVEEVWDEAMPLLRLSWREVGDHPDAPNPSIETYAAAERVGFVHVFTVRSGGVLIGLAVFSLVPSMHRPSELQATCDSVIVHPLYRDTGAGYGLLQNARDAMVAAGARAVFVNETRKHRLRSLMKTLGFEAIETVHVYRPGAPHG